MCYNKLELMTVATHEYCYAKQILTVCAFILPVIKANKSVSDIEMVQSAVLAAEESSRGQELDKCKASFHLRQFPQAVECQFAPLLVSL